MGRGWANAVTKQGVILALGARTHRPADAGDDKREDDSNGEVGVADSLRLRKIVLVELLDNNVPIHAHAYSVTNEQT